MLKEKAQNYLMGCFLVSREFDCYVHKQCILDRLEAVPDDPEALIFANEFNLLPKE